MPASQAGNVRALLVAIAPSSAPHIHTNLENFLLSKEDSTSSYKDECKYPSNAKKASQAFRQNQKQPLLFPIFINARPITIQNNSRTRVISAVYTP